MHHARYSKELVKVILDQFSKAIKSKEYSERIPYNAWRDISNAEVVEIIVEKDILVLYGGFYADIRLEQLFTDRTYNWGFGRFYCDNYIKQEKENDTMMPSMNFDFGPCTENVAISPYGMAVQTKEGRFLTYDAKNGKTIDVTGFTFHFKNTIYKMPAAIKDLRPGAMVLHQGKPMYVTSVEKGVEVVDILASEAKTILPVSNMFGFDYVTTIVSFMNLGTTTPTSDNPFGNLMPFMMAQMVFGEDGSLENIDMGKMMMLSMMTGQQNPFTNFFGIAGTEPQSAS